jgi:hypothetical protein
MAIGFFDGGSHFSDLLSDKTVRKKVLHCNCEIFFEDGEENEKTFANV